MNFKTEPYIPPTPQRLNTSTEWLTRFTLERWYYWQASANRRGIELDVFRSIASMIARQWIDRGVTHASYNEFEQHLINATALHYKKAYQNTNQVNNEPKGIAKYYCSRTSTPEPKAEQVLNGDELSAFLAKHGYNFNK